ncbi:P fimbria major subunit PapA [Escherichia coli]|uniref:P fimbria major subunit PapA n=5 Tax=Escherichia coli TaxID=562 RepID=UPI000C7C9393|nr:P fimbria major subunit PapA [Escherichia coli]MDW6171553.1 P fimbria major subunit PapA [Escherichia coli]MDW6604165.1 P fimbria major subunit PapA [Escherichia coli]MDW6623457.1 P fimbria major subunit PapA [Escherichia coli]MDW6816564.1 P fimbria major subunit PapA [Escherichia coli]MDW6907853.1 P fimbria major subunit PapA [Escherichia coli]
MIKSVIAGAVAMAVVSFGVNAALTTPQGQGRVTFNGTVVDAPCSISQKSADQSIDFGQLSKSFLQAGGVSKPMNLDIELVNCDITSFKGVGGAPAAKKGTVKLAFSGPRVSGHNEELDTSGGTGTAIVVQAAGKNVSFDGTEGDANTLKDGDNVLHYTAIVKKSSANNAQVTEGAFSAVATGDAANLLI